MKYTHWVFLFSILITIPLAGANRNYEAPLPKKSEPVETVVPVDRDPIEEDRKTDIALFNYFVKILANFGHILLDPHNIANVTYNAGKMIDGVVSVAQELTRKPVEKKEPTKKQLDTLVRLISRALTRQGLLPPHQVAGYSIS